MDSETPGAATSTLPPLSRFDRLIAVRDTRLSYWTKVQYTKFCLPTRNLSMRSEKFVRKPSQADSARQNSSATPVARGGETLHKVVSNELADAQRNSQPWEFSDAYFSGLTDLDAVIAL